MTTRKHIRRKLLLDEGLPRRESFPKLNTKDFKPFILEDKPSVIALSTGLTNAQIDVKICKVLKKIKPSELRGHLISISNEGEEIKKKS
jgi:hypothetical protein